jgi:hypothetical protein
VRRAAFPRSHDFIADIHCCIPWRVAYIRICRGAPDSEQGVGVGVGVGVRVATEQDY